MMKGSSGGRGFGGSNFAMNPLSQLSMFLPQTGGGASAGANGSRGNSSGGQLGYMSNFSSMPEYVNYQQMPTYSSASVAPSEAIMRFLSSGYASGGAAKAGHSLEDDIQAAIRLARMIGMLTKNL